MSSPYPPVPNRHFGGWDAFLAVFVFAVPAAALVWGPRLLLGPGWFGWWRGEVLGGVAVASAALVGLLHARGLARRAWAGDYVKGYGARIVFVSYAAASVAIATMLAVLEAEPALFPLAAVGAFLFACVVLSPGFLVGMLAAALYSAIVRSESWGASSLTYPLPS